MTTFNNSPITVGNGNEVIVIAGYDNIDMQFEKLKDDVLDVINVLEKNSAERRAAEYLYGEAIKRDKKGVINIVKMYAKEFTSKVFVSVASSFLVNFIKGMLKI